MLVAADINPPADVEKLIDAFWEQYESLDAEDKEPGVRAGKIRTFADERVRGVLSQLQELDALIEPLLVNWDYHRLGSVERTVMRLGAWELKNCPDIPPGVAINEAVDLANWFSTPKSRGIVNGVLDKLKTKLRT